MPRLTRRHILQASTGIAVGSIAGCTSLGGRAGDADQPHTCPTSPSEGRPSASVYISAIVPNPEGSDRAALNDETVVLELARDGPTDLAGYTLVYCQRHAYEFPDTMSDIESGATIEIHTGDGESGVDASAPPEYNLFVGQTEPLLSNDGMQLTITSSAGDVLDSIRYPSLGPGERYVRPE